MWPGPGGPVPVARSRWPGPGGPVPVARSRWPCPTFFVFCCGWPGPGAGPGPGPPMVWFWWRGGPVLVSVPAPVPVRSACGGGAVPVLVPGPCPCPVPGGRVPVPIKRITYAVWPASMSPGMDAQSLPGIWLFYTVLQTTGERQTILRSRNHYRTKTGAKRLPKPTACQHEDPRRSQFGCSLLRASLLTVLFARCVLPGTVLKSSN